MSDTLASDPLLGGFYTVAQAARLLRVSSTQRVYRWLRSANGGAVIERDYEPLTRAQEISFWDLIEIRFVEHFRSQGLSLQYLRRVAERARTEFGQKHPFALSVAEYLTNRKKIFIKTAENEQRSVREFLSDQYEMYETIEAMFARGISFNPQTLLAEEWRPLDKSCPNVIINPRYAYGQPVIGSQHVPTAALYRQWRAEKGDKTRVANWWRVDPEEVDEAIEFETRLAA